MNLLDEPARGELVRGRIICIKTALLAATSIEGTYFGRLACFEVTSTVTQPRGNLVSRRPRFDGTKKKLTLTISPSRKSEGTPSDLDSIIREAKLGEDANTRLRHDLIRGHDDNFDKYYYDKHSYPWEYAWYNQTVGNRSGIPIEMNINFHRVYSVDIVNSVMDLVVWYNIHWVDPRLTWDPEEYGGLDAVWFWVSDGGAGGETSEIWTPDVELWNLETGIKRSMEHSYARVTHEGLVKWGGPGHLRPACKFSGLGSFPFDRLTCTMEFGSWRFSGKYLRMEKWKGVGYTIGGSATSGERYMEYSLAEEDPISCEKHAYTYESAPEDPWPVLMYNVTVVRSWRPYVRGYLLSQIILNLVGFSAFWLPPSCGERMGLSITAMLAALASEIVVSAFLPACNEMTWIAKFSIISMMFAFISLMESVVVLYLYYKTCEDLVPHWYAFAKNWYLVRVAKKGGVEIKKAGTEVASRTNALVSETTATAIDALQNTTEKVAAHVKDTAKRLSNDITISDDRVKYGGYDDSEDEKDSEVADNNMRKACNGAADDSSMGNRGVLGSLDTSRSMNGMLTSAITELPSLAPKSADDFRNEQELENNLRWKKTASRIDDIARFWIPAAFFATLAIISARVYY